MYVCEDECRYLDERRQIFLGVKKSINNFFPSQSSWLAFELLQQASALHHHRSPIKRPATDSSIKGENFFTHTMKYLTQEVFACTTDPCINLTLLYI